MRIRGEQVNAREYRIVTLERKNFAPLKLKVFALPLGFRREYELVVPKPQPPVSTIVVKGVPQEKYNYNDQGFIDALTEHRELVLYYMFYKATADDKDVTYENHPQDITSLRLFRDELQASGISDGDIQVVIKAALEAGNIKSEDVDKAKEDF